MIIFLRDLILEDSNTSKQAKQLGLDYIGFGRYGKDGKVTHISQNGKLIPYTGKGNDAASTGTKKRDVPRHSVLDDPNHRAERLRGTVRATEQPTKENPSFDELRDVARQHEYTIMTQKPLGDIRPSNPVGEANAVGKPNGFWFAVGSEWIDWTATEMPKWKGDNLYSVEVDESQCIVIEDELGLREFHRQYSTSDGMIDWAKVGKDAKGIIFKKYFPQARMKYRWYYTWDVASGCVWDTTALKGVEQQSVGTDK